MVELEGVVVVLMLEVEIGGCSSSCGGLGVRGCRVASSGGDGLGVGERGEGGSGGGGLGVAGGAGCGSVFGDNTLDAEV